MVFKAEGGRQEAVPMKKFFTIRDESGTFKSGG
jgi:hypothetical protein